MDPLTEPTPAGTPPPGSGMSLFSATMVGVGAIVGGGILALAGTAFAVTGPGALLAFGANAVIAVLTALSFAELVAAFPQSGGTYTYAKKVMPVGTAFGVGWIVYFASIVAGVLYGLGFAAFLLGGVRVLAPGWDAWTTGRWPVTVVAALATGGLTWRLCRTPGGGGQFVNLGKVVVFSVLIVGGIVVYAARGAAPSLSRALTPFLPAGVGGLITAMGYTFIALQGFDLVAAVAGEVRDPRRNVPRAMFASLALSVGIYIPLLLVVLLVGTPAGESVMSWAESRRETALADAASRFLGPFGFWLVMAAGILSMFSALQANLFAASRLAQAMARDRTFPRPLEADDRRSATPRNAILATGALTVVIFLLVGNVAAAGAASSLIFLITFAFAHLICILARLRGGRSDGFRVPFFPVLPVLGLLACTALAVFQGIAVPVAGAISGGWLVLGGFLYSFKLGRRARSGPGC